MNQAVNRKLFEGVTGTVQEEVPNYGGSFLALEVNTLGAGTVTVTAGIVGEHTLVLTNAETDAKEGSATAPGLWWAFISPYDKVIVKGTGIAGGDNVWVGVQ